MEKTTELRNLCAEAVQKRFAKSGVTVSELNGNNFAGAEVAVKDGEEITVYRITIIRHNREREHD